MTQPTERRFVMEPRLDAEVATINNALDTKVDLTDPRLTDERTPLDNSVTSAKIVDGTIVNADIADTTIESAKLAAQDYIKFDTTYAGGSTQPGELAWDQANETLQFQVDADVTLQIGQEHLIRVKNASGSVAIPDRTVVMFAGATGDTITVAPAVSDGTYPVHYLAGITTEQIPADGFGFVTQLGFINHVDTNLWPVGTLLYVDPATPGGLTDTEPAAPAWTGPVAAVTKQNQSAGRILVRAIPAGGSGGGASVVVSDTAPGSGSTGDMWYDSTDGTLYVYYADVDGSQWVQVQANSALTAGIESRLGALEASNVAAGTTSPNYVINGGFDFWQRGTTFSSVAGGTYTADRWVTQPGMGAQTVTRVTDTPTGYGYALRLQRSAVVGCGIVHRIEASNTVRLIGKTLTVSYWAKTASVGQSVRAQLWYPSATDNFATTTYSQSLSSNVTSTWTKYSFTFTPLASSFSTGLELRIGTTSSAIDTHDVYIADVQLELGTTATAFRRNANSIQGELAACQRYYEKSYDQATAPGTATINGLFTFYGTTDGSQNIVTPIRFQVPKRTASHTMTSYNSVGTSGQADCTRNGYSGSLSTTLYRANENMFHFYSGVGGVFGAANMSLHWTCSAEL